MLGFMPRTHGLFFPFAQEALLGSPLFALINGSAAVALFFVLSGFVLTFRGFEGRGPTVFFRGALKRWPRLALPVMTSTIVSGLLLANGLYANAEVGTMTDSAWLAGYFGPSPYAHWPDVLAAAYEGSVATFLFRAHYFNSVLWTMYFEFFGSFLTFGFAYILWLARNYWLLAAAIVMAIVAWLCHPFFLCFICGTVLAKLYASPTAWQRTLEFLFLGRLKPLMIVFWAMVIVFLLGYHEALVPRVGPTGVYAFAKPLFEASRLMTRVAFHAAGSILLLLLVLGLAQARTHLGGKLGAYLGAMSFPIYLTHFIIICSLSSWAYLAAQSVLGQGPALVALVFAVTVVGTFVTAVPLMFLDQWWLQFLRNIEKKAFAHRPPAKQAAR
jgi:peptidoglycan/LPS O-acetylase OafA/YrhL